MARGGIAHSGQGDKRQGAGGSPVCDGGVRGGVSGQTTEQRVGMGQAGAQPRYGRRRLRAGPGQQRS